eukprot:c43371_g1_i1 orf=652-834(+)
MRKSDVDQWGGAHSIKMCHTWVVATFPQSEVACTSRPPFGEMWPGSPVHPCLGSTNQHRE